MDTLIIDVGCSYLKMAIYQGERLCEWWKSPTPKTANEIVESVSLQYWNIRQMDQYRISQTMVISYSDSVFYQMKNGKIDHVPVFTDIPIQDGLPDYQVAGKPRNSELKGAGNYLLYLKNEVGLEWIDCILPPSTFIARHLTGNRSWKKWDITHASNSGMWDYKRSYWCKEMQPFIEADVIEAEVVSPGAVLYQEQIDEMRVLVGGMDSVFANARDVPYSSKPYLSLGTWVTASVESYFIKRDRKSPTRFVIAPNGTILEQLCFNAGSEDYEVAYQLTTDFFDKKFLNMMTPVIDVFGGWSESGLHHWWHKHPYLRFRNIEPEGDSYLHREAALYAQHSKREADGLHLPIDVHQPQELSI